MPKRRKEGNKFTTISIKWEDKEILRTFADFKRDTKNGKLYETDSEIFNRIIIEYELSHGKNKAHPTYPTIREPNNI